MPGRSLWSLVFAWGLIACTADLPVEELPLADAPAEGAAALDAQPHSTSVGSLAVSYTRVMEWPGPGPDGACSICGGALGAYACSDQPPVWTNPQSFFDPVARYGQVKQITVKLFGQNVTDPARINVYLNGTPGTGTLLGTLELPAQTFACGQCLPEAVTTVTRSDPNGIPRYFYRDVNALYLDIPFGVLCGQRLEVTVVAEFPAIQLSPTSIPFGQQPLGTTSTPQTITVRNTGGAPLSLFNWSVSGGFFELTQAPPPSSQVPPGGSATFSVVFKPTVRGLFTGTFQLWSSDDARSPSAVQLSGEGIVTLRPSPNPVAFGLQPINTTSSLRTVLLFNDFSVPITVQSISSKGPFTISGFTGPQTIAAKSNATFQVSFTPTATGVVSGEAVITSDANNSLFSVVLTGEGAVPRATLAPSSLSFGSQPSGTTSGARTVKVTNEGNDTLILSDYTVSGPFIVTSLSTPVTLAPGADTSFQVAFAPTAVQAFSGSLDITTNVPAGPSKLPLSGTGTSALLSISPTSISFGNRAVGSVDTRTVVISNTGTGPVTLQSAVTSAPFSVTGLTTPLTLAAGASRIFQVSFTPTTLEPVSGVLSLVSDASNGPHEVSLDGTGVFSEITLAPSSLGFGAQTVGVPSTAQTVVLSNGGTAPLTITAARISPPFSMTGLTVPLTLAPRGKSSVLVSFTPTALGTVQGSLVLTTNATNPTTELPLEGTGARVSLLISPTAVAFGSQAVGSTSAAKTVTLVNVGNATLTLEGLVASEPFAVTGFAPPLSLAPNASTTLQVTFSPTAAGLVGGALAFYGNAPDNPTVLPVSGTGLAPELTALPASLSFGDQLVGGTSAGQWVTVANTGTAPLKITEAPVFGDFEVSGLTAPLSLPVGASQRFQVTFKPKVLGPTLGTLHLASDAPGSPTVLRMEGRGTSALVVLEPTSLDFGGQRVGGTSAPRAVKISNPGTAPLTISGLAVEEPFFVAGASTPLRVLSGQSATVPVQFKPSEVGAASGQLSLTTDASAEPFTVALSGTGLQLTVEPTRLDFGRVQVGKQSLPQAVTITNQGSMALQVAEVVSSSEAFQVDTRAVAEPIAPGQSRMILVTFRPVAKESAQGEVRLKLQGEASSELTVSMAGVGWDDLVEGGGYSCSTTGEGSTLLSVLAGLALLQRRLRGQRLRLSLDTREREGGSR